MERPGNKLSSKTEHCYPYIGSQEEEQNTTIITDFFFVSVCMVSWFDCYGVFLLLFVCFAFIFIGVIESPWCSNSS